MSGSGTRSLSKNVVNSNVEKALDYLREIEELWTKINYFKDEMSERSSKTLRQTDLPAKLANLCYKIIGRYNRLFKHLDNLD